MKWHFTVKFHASRALALGLLALGGCGEDGRSGVNGEAIPPSRPVPVLTAGPVARSEAQIAGTSYLTTSAVQEVHWSRDQGGDPHTLLAGELSLGNFSPHQLIVPGTAGATGELWIVGFSSNPSQMQLRSYSDANADGVIETSSFTTLVSGAGPGFITSAAFSDAEGALYLLDGTTRNVYRAYDTGTDRRPDMLGSAAFAQGTWVPGDSLPHTYSYTDPESLVVTIFPTGSTSLAQFLARPMACSVDVWSSVGLAGTFSDTNWDMIADAVTSPSESIEPTILEFDLVAGMNSVQVRGQVGAIVQIRTVDAAGTLLSVLGSITLANSVGVVTLAADLVAGARVRAVDMTHALQSRSHEVAAARAYVYHREQVVVKLPLTHSIVFHGVHLEDIDSVKILRDLEPVVALSLSFAVSDGGRILTATVPANAVVWSGVASLQLVDSDLSAPQGPYVATQTCTVCGEGE